MGGGYEVRMGGGQIVVLGFLDDLGRDLALWTSSWEENKEIMLVYLNPSCSRIQAQSFQMSSFSVPSVDSLQCFRCFGLSVVEVEVILNFRGGSVFL